jgi:hypothetical protein
MTLDDVLRMPALKGHTTIFSFDPDNKRVSSMVSQKNRIMDNAAEVVARLLVGHAANINTMYFEYVNLENEGDTPVPPTFDKADGVSYYTGLEYAYDKDFIRVPAQTNATLTENDVGSFVASFFAITPGDEVGFWGKDFSDASNSAVYGGALVSALAPSTQANDLIFARNYPTGAKLLKPPGEQIAMLWNIEVSLPEA